MKEFLSLSYSQLRRNYVIFSGVGIDPILQLACGDCHLYVDILIVVIAP